MRFDTSQSMKMGQQMKLGPRMIQSMEILQMPLAELEERLAEELSSNPTLELAEVTPETPTDGDATRDLNENGRDTRDTDADRELNAGNDNNADDFERLGDFEDSQPEYAENAYDSALPSNETPYSERPFDAHSPDDRHDPGYSAARMAGEPDGKLEAMSNTPARAASLHDQLHDQWALVDLDPRLRELGDVLISFLDDDGYLRTPLAEIAEKTDARLDPAPDADELQLALTALQMLLEPAGIAARDARECLLLQLDAQLDQEEQGSADRDPTIHTAYRLIEDHFDDLMNNRLPRIAEKGSFDLDEIKLGLERLRRLSLAPGRRLVTERHEPITPDAIVEYDEEQDRYVPYLNDSRIPSLRVNREYAMMARDRAVPQHDREFLKKNLANASWLIDAIGQRKQTLLRVLTVVVEEQRDWFDYGPDALKPLPMTAVAERLGVHVATVSRAVADKHILTPRGTAPLRGFFTGGLQTESGEDMSYDAVKAALKEVIEHEDKRKPFSDEALVKQLDAKGIEIARRTIAKYRDQMGIPAARMRKQF